MNILLTGGAGYIGSHVAAPLVSAGHRVICFDNLSNSDPAVMDRLEAITGHAVPLVTGDIRDGDALRQVLHDHEIEAVVHFAGLKAVGESVAEPIKYYDNNVRGTLSLLEAMADCGTKTLVFSSSATVYGQPQYLPLDESHPTSATNPYGRTKLMIEEMLADVAAADPEWRIAILRYFNPVGAHDSGLIGENPNGIPNNLMPFVSRVAAGRLAELSVFGNDYDTPDGTGVRDYIHVSDLAAAHVLALEALIGEPGRSLTMNCGYGRGFSVLEVLDAVDRVTNLTIERRLEGRRAGDPDSLISDNGRIKATLPWVPQHDDLETIVGHALQWERKLAEIRGGP